MINNFVLDRDHLDEFLECILGFGISENAEVNNLIEVCNCHISTVNSNNYFFSKNIQKKISKNIYPEEYLNKVYELQKEKAFNLEELDSRFINFLLLHTSNLHIDLDSHLKEIQEDFINSNYGKQVRY